MLGWILFLLQHFLIHEFKINGTAYKPGVGKLKMNAEGTYTFMPDKDYYSTLSNPASTETIISGNLPVLPLDLHKKT